MGVGRGDALVPFRWVKTDVDSKTANAPSVEKQNNDHACVSLCGESKTRQNALRGALQIYSSPSNTVTRVIVFLGRRGMSHFAGSIDFYFLHVDHYHIHITYHTHYCYRHLFFLEWQISENVRSSCLVSKQIEFWQLNNSDKMRLQATIFLQMCPTAVNW